MLAEKEEAVKRTLEMIISKQVRFYERTVIFRMVLSWLCLIGKYAVLIVTLIWFKDPVFTLGLFLQMFCFFQAIRIFTTKDADPPVLYAASLILLQFLFLGDIRFPAACLVADLFDFGWWFCNAWKMAAMHVLLDMTAGENNYKKRLEELHLEPGTEVLEFEISQGMILQITTEDFLDNGGRELLAGESSISLEEEISENKEDIG